MAAPVVQNLNQILAELEPAFGASRNLYNQQIGMIPGQTQAAKQATEYAKTNSFRDIARSANTRGLDFWGIPIEEQGRYLGEKYLPSLANIESSAIKQQTDLQLALAELEKEKYTLGINRRSEQEKALREYESEQQRIALERERMNREDARARASQAAASRNPAKEFLNYIADQFKMAGGQGNQNITRQQQDRWAEAFFTTNKVEPQARQMYWDLFNNTYNRASNYWEDPRYRR